MNCSKEHVETIIDKYWKKEWEKIKSTDLPFRREFPIKEQEMLNEFNNLRTKELNGKSNSKIVVNFFSSIVTANKGGHLSPVNYWKKLQEDSEEFKKFYRNRLLNSDWFKEKKGKNMEFLERGEVPLFIYSIGATTSGKAPIVSYFKPALAKNIINKYLSEYSEIFDPCAGYGGRLLGTLATGKKYIGYDINDITVAENNTVKNWLETNFNDVPESTITTKDSFNSTGTFECLFTCPPYSKPISKTKNQQIEEWVSSTGKISCEYTCDEIIDKLLENYDCQKYVIVVDESAKKYQDYIAEKITNTNYINARDGKPTNASKNYEAVVVITKSERDKLIAEKDSNI